MTRTTRLLSVAIAALLLAGVTTLLVRPAKRTAEDIDVQRRLVAQQLALLREQRDLIRRQLQVIEDQRDLSKQLLETARRTQAEVERGNARAAEIRRLSEELRRLAAETEKHVDSIDRKTGAASPVP